MEKRRVNRLFHFVGIDDMLNCRKMAKWHGHMPHFLEGRLFGVGQYHALSPKLTARHSAPFWRNDMR